METNPTILEARAYMNDSDAQRELKRLQLANYVNELVIPDILAKSDEQ